MLASMEMLPWWGERARSVSFMTLAGTKIEKVRGLERSTSTETDGDEEPAASVDAATKG